MADTMTAPAPAAPAAPAPAAPAAAPRPAAPSRPSAPASRSRQTSAPANNIDDAFGQLNNLAENEPQEQFNEQRNPPRNKPQPQPVETPAEEQAAPVQTPEAKPAETGFPDSDKTRTMRAGELSRHYKALKAEFDKAQAKITELSSKPVDTERLTRLEQEAKDNHSKWEKAQEELRFTKYEKSQEYQDKYWKPYEKAYTDGAKRTASLTVVPRTNPDTGEVTQEARQATAGDFQQLMGIMDDNKAAEVAEQLFGPKAALVLMARERALDLNNAREEALENFRQEGGKIEAARQENTKKINAEISGLFESEAKAAIEKYPTWFAPDSDEKGNELLQKSMEFVDSAYKGEFKDASGNVVKLTPQEVAKRHSAVRNKAAAFDRLVYRNQNLLKQVSDLQKKLADYSASEPGSTPARKEKKTAFGSTMDSVLEGLGA